MNQSLIVPHYFKLLVWPTDLVLDYGYVAPLALSEVLPYAAALIASCALVGWLWLAKPRAGLPFVLCLLLLAPTTLVPIISEVGAERRMYLPSLVLIAAILVYAWQVIPRKILIATSAVLIGALAVISVKRNAGIPRPTKCGERLSTDGRTAART